MSLFPGDRLTKSQTVKRRWMIAAVMNLALVMVVMGVSSVNVALPTFVRDLGASGKELQWIVNSYALVFAGLLLTMGAVGDRFGRRGAFFSGLGVYAVASVFSAYSGSPTELIVWRGIMGIGAALIMPATLSIITNVFPEKDRPKAVAMWAGFAGAGASIGPVVSGLLLKSFWWGSIFLSLIPVILVAALLTYMFVPTSKDPEEQALDWGGSIFSVIGLGALLFGIIEGPESGWSSPAFGLSMIVAAAAFYEFIKWERRTKHPMLPLEFFRSRMFSVSSMVILLSFFSMFGLFFVLAQYLQFVQGDSALAAAVKMLPLAGTFVLFSQIGPALAKRYSMRNILVVSLLMVAGGVFMFSGLTPTTSYGYLLVSLVVMGGGMAVAMPLSTDGIMSSIPKRKAGVGSAINDTTREVGGALGIAVLGSLLASSYRASVSDRVVDAPTEVFEAASESIGGALQAAGQLGEGGAEIVAAANVSFTDGMTTTFIAAGVVILLGAVIVAVFLPKTTD